MKKRLKDCRKTTDVISVGIISQDSAVQLENNFLERNIDANTRANKLRIKRRE